MSTHRQLSGPTLCHEWPGTGELRTTGAISPPESEKLSLLRVVYFHIFLLAAVLPPTFTFKIGPRTLRGLMPPKFLQLLALPSLSGQSIPISSASSKDPLAPSKARNIQPIMRAFQRVRDVAKEMIFLLGKKRVSTIGKGIQAPGCWLWASSQLPDGCQADIRSLGLEQTGSQDEKEDATV